MDDARAQLADKLTSASNILVTVSRDPTVDQLSALLGLTLLLNKQNKHAAAVFSGQTPSTIEFLRPEETIEKNTNSLRDFIIALDKNKADKLRYKVEDDVVRIFITPYKTSISQEDFDFSQGDFNVDVVVALGVQRQEDLDEAITAHGRILHDATVASINTSAEGGLGSINWYVPDASSLSELVAGLSESLAPDLLDEQIATALLTGIVSETDRFRNEKTSSQTMSVSAILMNAGANQQLVASELEVPVTEPPKPSDDDTNDEQPEAGGDKPADDTPPPASDGSIHIDHSGKDAADGDDSGNEPLLELPSPVESDTPAEPGPEPEPSSEIKNDTATPLVGSEPSLAGTSTDWLSTLSPGSKLMTEPPVMGGTLTANSSQPTLEPSTDPFSMPTSEPPQLLNRDKTTLPAAPSPVDPHDDTPAPPAWVPPAPPADLLSAQPSWMPPAPSLTPPPALITPAPPEPPTAPALPTSPAPPAPTHSPPADNTLTQLEQTVGSSHAAPVAAESIDAVRDEVNRALSDIAATNTATPEPIEALNAQPIIEGLHDLPTEPTPPSPQVTDPNAPPPVPPPIPFNFGTPSSS